LNYTYDCDGCVTIDDNGVLSVDPSDLSDEVNKATGYLTNAINADSNDFFAVIKVTNANDNVAFARTGRGTITRNGKKEQVNVIELDFDDAKYLRGDKDLINVFDYTTIAHEVRHLYPDAANDPEPSFSGRERGTVVNAVNEIMLATGRPLRANYYADSSAQYNRVVNFGSAERDGKEVKRGKDGIVVKTESKKVIQWTSTLIKGGIN
jgi:hypothetical protein